MQQFLQYRLGSHQLPIVLSRFAGGQHVARANRVYIHCGSVAIADELHMIFKCPALQAVRQQYAPLFLTGTNIMRSAQQDHCKFSSWFYAVVMSSRLNKCLLYVVRLAGWPKHCLSKHNMWPNSACVYNVIFSTDSSDWPSSTRCVGPPGPR